MAQSPSESYIPSVLQDIAVSDYRRQPPFGYFSLPTEIRDMIMELVFVQAQVTYESTKAVNRDRKLSLLQKAFYCVKRTVSRRSYEGSKFTHLLQPPGFQFLATCRQACTEGHVVFYSLNVFYLPPGPLEYTLRGLKTLRPQHLAMITKIGLTMDLLDLTPAGFKEVQHEMQVRYGHGSPVPDRPSLAQGIQWSRMIDWRLKSIWKAKLNFIVTHSEGLKLLKIVVPEKSRDFDANDMAEAVEFSVGKERDIYWSLEMGGLVRLAQRLVQEEVQNTVRVGGWKALQAKLGKGAFATTNRRIWRRKVGH
ncbi:MAG: hypothetical protein Q9175_005832 [Cornicularia normoerica]